MASPLFTALDVTKRQLKLISLAGVAAGWCGAVARAPSRICAARPLADGRSSGVGRNGSACALHRFDRRLADARGGDAQRPAYQRRLCRPASRTKSPGIRQCPCGRGAARRPGGTARFGSRRHRRTGVKAGQRKPRSKECSRGAMRRSLAMLVAAAVSLAAYSVVAPESVGVSVRRAFGAHLKPPTRTVIVDASPAQTPACFVVRKFPSASSSRASCRAASSSGSAP